jgi:hypothetical protein
MAIPIDFYSIRRAFLHDPLSLSLTTPTVKEEPVKIINDYHDEIPNIRKQILQSNSAHFQVVKTYVEVHIFKTRTTHDCPFKFLPNYLGIFSITEPILKTEIPYDVSFEPLIIETGNLIYMALKSECKEVYYFENMRKIIVLSSSMLSRQELQVVFEKHAFKTGFYPIVEEERTEFDDLTLHISDEPAPRAMPFILPAKEEIYTYLYNHQAVYWIISPEIMSLIAEKLKNRLYTPEKTIYSLARDFLDANILLRHNQITTLESALIRYSRK